MSMETPDTTPDFTEHALNLVLACFRENAQPSMLISLGIVARHAESKGLTRSEALQAITRAISRGWIEFGPLPGQVRLTQEGMAALQL
jgi:N-acetylmuramoyl-L-alanine amidase